MRKKNRLSGAEIRALSSPRRLHGELFSLSFFPTSSDSARFACVVSKKVAGSAVKRNLIKRRVREAVRIHIGIAPAGSYLWYAKGGAVHAPYHAIEKDLAQLLQQVARMSSARYGRTVQ